MKHNTAITICFVASLVFIGFLMVEFSAWYAFLLLALTGFKTDKEMDRDQK